jgi:hypothetical protein
MLDADRLARSRAGMVRPLRIDREETFCHVLNRGNERRAIFRDARGCEGFLMRQGRCAQRFSLDKRGYWGC